MTIFNESKRLQKKVDELMIECLSQKEDSKEETVACKAYQTAKKKLENVLEIEKQMKEITPKLSATIAADEQDAGHLWKEYQDLKKQYFKYIKEE